MFLKEKGQNWRGDFRFVTNSYVDDLPYPLALDAELSLWMTYWEAYQGLLPHNIVTTIKPISFYGLEHSNVTLHISPTLPNTSCECERTISALRTLKNYKRSTMVERTVKRSIFNDDLSGNYSIRRKNNW